MDLSKINREIIFERVSQGISVDKYRFIPTMAGHTASFPAHIELHFSQRGGNIRPHAVDNYTIPLFCQELFMKLITSNG
jgi:hypothetical protein